MSTLRRTTLRTVPLIVLVVLAAGLGFAGFQEHVRATGQQQSQWDVIYLTVQLFLMESGAVDGVVNWKLQVARFLAPITTIYAVIQTVVALFAVQTQRVWLWLRGGHIVVCGLGRKGVRLVEQLRSDRWRVVVIENDPDNDDLAYCRALGAITLIGAANDEWTLRKSHVARAAVLIVVTGDDGTNIETAVIAHRLNRRRSSPRKPLRCIVHVREPRLSNLFQDHQIYGDPDDPFQLELFNLLEVAARSMLREPPVLLQLDGKSQRPPHLLVVGMGSLGEAVVHRAIKDWAVDGLSTNDCVQITVIDTKAEERERQFRMRYPQLTSAAQLRFVAMDVHSADFAQGAFVDEANPNDAISAAYVCIDNDSVAMSAALTLRRFFQKPQIPIVVRMAQQAGLASLLSEGDGGQAAISGIRAVGLLDLTCQSEIVLGGSVEVLAQAIHQSYLFDQLAKGEKFGSGPSLVSWDALKPDLKESNRQQARHVPEKLALVGCQMVASTENPFSLVEFTEGEIEVLAEDEHRRWVAERKAVGWTRGAAKDVNKKTTPYLVSWDQLCEEVKQIDRNLVRRLPANLAKADYEIRRIETDGQSNQ